MTGADSVSWFSFSFKPTLTRAQKCLSCLWNQNKIKASSLGQWVQRLLWRYDNYCLPAVPPPLLLLTILFKGTLQTPPIPTSPFSSPPGMSWKLSGFEGSKKEAESNALVCEKGTVIETSTSYMLTLSCNNTVIFFFFFSLNTQLQWTSIQTTERLHTL